MVDELSPDADVSEINGVTDASVTHLRMAGYKCVRDVQEASQVELTEVSGVGTALAARMKAHVGDLPEEEEESWVALPRDALDDFIDEVQLHVHNKLEGEIWDLEEQIRSIEKPEPPAFEEEQVWEFSDGTGFEIRRITVNTSGDVTILGEEILLGGHRGGIEKLSLKRLRKEIGEGNLQYSEMKSKNDSIAEWNLFE